MNYDGELNSISQALKSREAIFEIFLVATLLSVGVTLFCDVFGENVNYRNFFLGLFFILTVFVYLIYKLLQSRKKSIVIDAMLSLDVQDNKIIKVPSYDFSREITEIFHAGFSENKAIEKQWKENPIVENSFITNNVTNIHQGKARQLESSEEKNTIQYFSNTVTSFVLNEGDITNPKLEEKEAKRLIVEAIEFMILESLSSHLVNYFRDEKHKPKWTDRESSPLVEFNFSDLVDLPQKNRFLALICSPIKNRAIFNSLPKQNLAEHEYVSTIRGSDGSIYKYLQLILPRESKLIRVSETSLELSNKRVTMKFNIYFNGFNKVIPSGFNEGYLCKKSNEVKSMKVTLKIETEVALLSLVCFWNWNYYLWMESFTSNLVNKYSFSTFLHKINWETVSTVIHVEKNLKKLSRRITPK